MQRSGTGIYIRDIQSFDFFQKLPDLYKLLDMTLSETATQIARGYLFPSAPFYATDPSFQNPKAQNTKSPSKDRLRGMPGMSQHIHGFIKAYPCLNACGCAPQNMLRPR